MKKILSILFFIACTGVFANDISKINQIKKEAEEAYKKGDYAKAASSYSYLIDTLHLHDEKAIMNLGHAYFQMEKADLAQSQYQKITGSKDQTLKSMAYQQLGALSNDPKTLQKAMSYFKESIKADPTNQDARYNYELVKKKLKEQEDQNQNQEDQDQNQDEQQKENDQQKDQDQKGDQQQDNQDQKQNENKEDKNNEQQGSEDQQKQEEDKENQEKEGQKSEENKEDKKEGDQQEQSQSSDENKEGEEKEGENQPKPSPSENMQEMKISEEKAKMILEALKNSEVQYIQQNRRKPSKKKDSDKPDW